MSQITVTVPTYNRVQKLGRALRSCITQTQAPARVVVVDNGENPGTPAMVESCARDASFPIHYLRSEKFNVRKALLTGILAVETEWMIQLDDDDFLVPDRIANDELLLNGIASDVVTVEHEFIRVDYNRRLVWIHPIEPEKLTLQNALCIDCFGPPAVATFRTEALVKHNPYHYKEGLTDYDLRSCLLAHGRAHGVKQPSFVMDDTKLPQRLTSDRSHIINSVLLHGDRYRQVAIERGLDTDGIDRRLAAQVAFFAGKLIGVSSVWGPYSSAVRRNPAEWLKGLAAPLRDWIPPWMSRALPTMRGSRTLPFHAFARIEPELLRLIELNAMPTPPPGG